MMNTSVKNDISFQAKVGKRLLRQVRKEFDNNEIKVEKFEKMFQDTFRYCWILTTNDHIQTITTDRHFCT